MRASSDEPRGHTSRRGVLQNLPPHISADNLVEVEPGSDSTYLDMAFAPAEDGGFKVLGVGSSGTVVEAERRADGLRVAAKIFHPGASELVDREWQIGSGDHGRHVVRIRAAGVVRCLQGLELRIHVMDLVAGPTFTELMNSRVTLTASQQGRFLKQGLLALERLGQDDIALRDIRPDNVRLTSDDLDTAHLVLLDPGAGKGPDQLSHQHRWGTMAYLAPEYLLGHRSGPESDVFAFGAMFADTMTHGRGFQTPTADLDRVTIRCLDEAPNLSQTALAPEVARILRGMLVKQPANRPTPTELLSEWDHPVVDDRTWDCDTPIRTSSEIKDIPTRPGEVPTERFVPAKTQTLPARVHKPAMQHSLPPLGFMSEPKFPAEESRTMRFAGVNPTKVHDDTDRTKYRAIGISLIGYFAYAVLGVTALAGMVTRGSLVHLPVGGLVGLLVATVAVSLDRIIMSDIPINMDWLEDPDGSSPLGRLNPWSLGTRITIALMFALVISEPVTLTVFNKDVMAAHETDVRAKLVPLEQKIVQDYAVKIAGQQKIVTLAQDQQKKDTALPDQLHQKAKEEEQGLGATGTKGCGPQCRLYLAQEKAARAALPGRLAAQQVRIDTAESTITSLTAERDRDVTAARSGLEADDGFFARQRVFFSALRENLPLLMSYVLITLVLIVFEMAGVMGKMITRGNTYELAVAREKLERERIARDLATPVARRSRLTKALLRERDGWRIMGDLEMEFANDRAYYLQAGVEIPEPDRATVREVIRQG